MSEYNKSKKTKKLVLILSAVGVLTLSLGIGLGVGLGTPLPANNKITDPPTNAGNTPTNPPTNEGETPQNPTPTPITPIYKETQEKVIRKVNGVDTEFSVVLEENTQVKSVKLPEYQITYNENYALFGNVLIPGTSSTTNYTNGKDDFFKFDYLDIGYVKFDFENGIITGGWERDETTNNAPTRITAVTTTNKDDYVWGTIWEGAIHFHIQKVIDITKKTTTDASPKLSKHPLFYQPDGIDGVWYLCLDPDPKKITTTTGESPETGNWDLFSSPPTDHSLPTNSKDLCTPLTEVLFSLSGYIPFLEYDASTAGGKPFSEGITTKPSRRNLLRFSDVNVLNELKLKSRISEVGFVTHPVFGKIKVNGYGHYVNPYTNEEEKITLTNNKVIFPERNVPLTNFKTPDYNSNSYEANYIAKLHYQYYQLSKEDQSSTIGTTLKEKIFTESQINTMYCVLPTISDKDHKKLLDDFGVYFDNSFKVGLTRTEKVKGDFNISGYLTDDTITTSNLECRYFSNFGNTGMRNKYIDYIMLQISRKTKIAKDYTPNIKKEMDDFMKKHNFFCTPITDAKTKNDKYDEFKKLFPSSTFTTWDDFVAKSRFLNWDTGAEITPIEDSEFFRFQEFDCYVFGDRITGLQI